MTEIDDRLGELRRQLSECSKRLSALEAAAIEAMIEAHGERDLTSLEARKAQARDRIVLLQKAIQQLERQQQLDAQAFMMRETLAFVEPLTKALMKARPSCYCRRTCLISQCDWSRTWSSRSNLENGLVILSQARAGGMNERDD